MEKVYQIVSFQTIQFFRFKPDVVAKHAAIYSYEHKMIHAFEGAAVCEVHLSFWWQRKIAAVFRFPRIT